MPDLLTTDLPFMTTTDIRIADYDYLLPDELIPRYPPARRDAARLLVDRHGELADTRFRNLPDYLPSGSLLVFNNSRVLPARLHFRRPTGAEVEILCLSPHDAHYEAALTACGHSDWRCLLGNARRWRQGVLEQALHIGRQSLRLTATRHADDPSRITFAWDPPDYTFARILDAAGSLPLPPYLNRDPVPRDAVTYQTVYASVSGSVAAPTAGLHFTPRLLAELDSAGYRRREVTLHVGAGTFRPVKGEIADHLMHDEYFTLSLETLETLHAALGSIIAVGTTAARTLESLYSLGCSIAEGNILPSPLNPDIPHVPQWRPYDACNNRLTSSEALLALIRHMQAHRLSHLVATTRLLILPDYTPRITRGIITNFHQPRSTLLLLIAAYCPDWRRLYRHALAHRYRFLSYGDATLLLP
ncbi:MAG: S-adenosylmethionine:tRNA ribosyltransferase-isomerase [Tannerellaceae bacterium]|nr:S-adenosylmethionine:tRNA ribosyltransferase-isomerase [Tannerellaceae bacterium]